MRRVVNEGPRAEGWPLSSMPESLAMARDYARRATRNRMDLRDDMTGVAYLALTDAERTFDPAAGASWLTHARKRVWGAIRDGLRVEYQRGACGLGKRTPMNTVEQAPSDFDPWVEDAPLKAVDDRDESAWLLASLPAAEASALALTCFGGLERAEAAESMGVSGSWFSFLRSRGIARLRRKTEVR